MGRHGELVREGSARLATTKFILACILQVFVKIPQSTLLLVLVYLNAHEIEILGFS